MLSALWSSALLDHPVDEPMHQPQQHSPVQSRSHVTPFACANLTSALVHDWIAHSQGLKALFFRQVRRGAQGISGAPLPPCKPISLAAPHFVVIGDSLANELAQVLRMLLPWATITYIAAFDLDAAGDSFDGVPGVFQSQLWLKLLAEQPWDAVFVGGLGVHRLLRRNEFGVHDWYHAPSDFAAGVDYKNRTLMSPYHVHHRLVRKWVQRLSCLSRVLKAPFFFFGSMPVEDEVMLLHPMKPDFWIGFYPTTTTNLMAAAERDVEAAWSGDRPAREQREIDEANATDAQWAPTSLSLASPSSTRASLHTRALVCAAMACTTALSFPSTGATTRSVSGARGPQLRWLNSNWIVGTSCARPGRRARGPPLPGKRPRPDGASSKRTEVHTVLQSS